MTATDAIELMTTNEVDEFNETLRSLEQTMKRHLAALRETRKVEKTAEAEKTTEQSVSGPPAKLPRSYSRLKRENTTTGSNSGPSRSDKVTVRVRIILLKVGDIDTLRDKFTADAFIQAKWREPSMDGRLKLQNEPINWDVYWNPRLWLENQLGDPKESVWHSVCFDINGQATICEKRRVHGSFMEFMELNEFPFDSQDLAVTVTSDRDDTELELVEDPRERCSLNVESFVDEQEWRLHRHVSTWHKIRTDSFKNSKKKHPAFSAAARTSRRPQFFMWNIFLVMCLICSLSFATFAVQLSLPQNRLQLTFILLLTTVSFKFVVNQSLPMIAYLTYLDKYILGSMAILATTCVWHAVISFANNRVTCQQQALWLADMIAFGILSSVYVSFHVIFFCVLGCIVRLNNKSDEKHQLGTFTSEEVNEGFDAYEHDLAQPNEYMMDHNWRSARGNIDIQNNGSAQHEVIQTLAGLDS